MPGLLSDAMMEQALGTQGLANAGASDTDRYLTNQQIKQEKIASRTAYATEKLADIGEGIGWIWGQQGAKIGKQAGQKTGQMFGGLAAATSGVDPSTASAGSAEAGAQQEAQAAPKEKALEQSDAAPQDSSQPELPKASLMPMTDEQAQQHEHTSKLYGSIVSNQFSQPDNNPMSLGASDSAPTGAAQGMGPPE